MHLPSVGTAIDQDSGVILLILTVPPTPLCRSPSSATPSIPMTSIPPDIPSPRQPPPYLLQALSQMTGPAVNNIGQAMSSPTVNESSSSQPLMIELQNGHYVRVSATVANGDTLPLDATPSRSRSSQSLSPMNSAPQAEPLPPAVLIFRDGHREEVRDYTIADGILYARGDYYTDGYWNKKINLATLNLPETMQANATRSVKFVLPSSPNEVITRP